MANGNVTDANGFVDALENALSINRLAVRIPPFNATDPELWFSMVETSFGAAGVTTDSTKFGYVVGAMDPKFAQEVREIIVNPPPHNAYTTLKTELIKRLSSTQEQKTRRLLESEDIGDRKPSQFLRHLRSLAGTAVPDSVLRPLWLGRLPVNMQVILATQRDAELDKAAELADAVAETSNPRVSISEAAVTSPTNTIVEQMQQMMQMFQQQIVNLRLDISELKTSSGGSINRREQRTRWRSRSRSQSRGHGRNGLCWYHWRYSADAKKCEQPCNFTSGNAGGSR
ncbi:uncharacterized protein LOC125501745 [Athalia rosae]|uniref:uncharacterized protein LOC125501745 n=1 Tax=Athalia rosae TaxID=37344 RepID=UPI0020331FE5|nr:uncharacterized protein LOC125501745 [Athalia rosae]